MEKQQMTDEEAWMGFRDGIEGIVSTSDPREFALGLSGMLSGLANQGAFPEETALRLTLLLKELCVKSGMGWM